MVKMLEVKWSAEAQGEVEPAEYSLLVAEYHPRGRLAALLRAEPSLTARMLQHTPGTEDTPPTHAVYIVEMVAGELSRVQGALRVEPGPEVPTSRIPSPVPMHPHDAIAGFQHGLTDAQFVQA
ncbi:MAG TPA: hypothetical protein VN554_03425 [Verrucomicrobiae bacterium]|nr:hypothetical protein [Verrucomicrobiae bacterium]